MIRLILVQYYHGNPQHSFLGWPKTFIFHGIWGPKVVPFDVKNIGFAHGFLARWKPGNLGLTG